MAGKLRNQLALAVKNKQWSYAIFWSSSSAQNGYASDQVFVRLFHVKIGSFCLVVEFLDFGKWVCWFDFFHDS